jgi:PEP-CTERM motif
MEKERDLIMRISTWRVGVALAVIGLVALASGKASADPIGVAVTTTGGPGNYTLGFSVTNNLGGTMDVYFFGTQLDSGRDITGSPSGFDPNLWTSWNNSGFGGSNVNYNNNWIDFSYSNLGPGATLGGFDVHSTDSALQATIPWFAWGYGGIYFGTGSFSGRDWNPGFESFVPTATTATPEPSTLAIAGLGGLGLLVYVRRRRAG